MAEPGSGEQVPIGRCPPGGVEGETHREPGRDRLGSGGSVPPVAVLQAIQGALRTGAALAEHVGGGGTS